ncbi:MAG: cation:dicarboxylase symporter family transporter, partial [Alistipes sp.]
MKQLLQKWNGISLIKRIVVGLIIGAVVGIFFPHLEFFTLLGTLFVSALKAVAPILVFFLVISALANAKSAGSMSGVILLYMVSTLVAALVAVAASFLFPVSITLTQAAEQGAPGGVGEVLMTLLMNVVANPVDALVKANYIGILAWAVVLGIALRMAAQSTKTIFSNIS